MRHVLSDTTKVWMVNAAILGLALAFAVTLLVAGAGAGAGATSATGTDDGPVVVDVVVEDFSFVPDEIDVPADTPVEFHLTNEGTAPHDLVIEGVDSSTLLVSGDSTVFAVDGLTPGTYRLLCSQPGHVDSGMVGTLTVGPVGDDLDAAGPHDARDDDLTPEEMAAMHDEGVAAFPAETDGHGNQLLEPEILEDGTKSFELTATEIEWEVEPGVWRDAIAYNGQVPGPRIDVDLGDRVQIVLHNELSVPTALHLHGLVLPNEMDGVPGLTQDSVLPGGSFTYELTVTNSGSHMYHSHFDSAHQVPSGLLGAFIVHDPDDPDVDHDVVMILNDGPLGYTINGKGFPATQPVAAGYGETVRVRYMNEGLQIHPMHLHGLPQRVVAKDGYPLDAPYTADNILVSPGDRVDVIVEATEPGAWAWHCHVLSHAEGPHGMFGMVTALVVEEP